MASMIELDNTEWALVEDLFDPPGREGAPARYPRRQIVDAILFLARTGCQWRYLPPCYPPWEAVWQQWRRWRSNGVWAAAMTRIAGLIRTRQGRTAKPSMVMIDGQTVRGGRAGPTFHEKGGRGGRTNGAKRSIVIEILGLPLAVQVESARPHDVSARSTSKSRLRRKERWASRRSRRSTGSSTPSRGSESSRPDASARTSTASPDRVLRHGVGLLVSAPGSTPGADPSASVARPDSQIVRILIESAPSGVVAVIVA